MIRKCVWLVLTGICPRRNCPYPVSGNFLPVVIICSVLAISIITMFLLIAKGIKKKFCSQSKSRKKSKKSINFISKVRILFWPCYMSTSSVLLTHLLQMILQSQFLVWMDDSQNWRPDISAYSENRAIFSHILLRKWLLKDKVLTLAPLAAETFIMERSGVIPIPAPRKTQEEPGTRTKSPHGTPASMMSPTSKLSWRCPDTVPRSSLLTVILQSSALSSLSFYHHHHYHHL